MDLSPELQAEFERWQAKIGTNDPYSGTVTLGIMDVLRAHFLLAEFFNEEGRGMAGVGPRDLNLLHSAVMRQSTQYAGIQKWDSNLLICATLFFGLIGDHPFHDANKRTALLCLLYQLEKLGLCPTISKKELEDFTVDIATHGALSKFAKYRELAKAGEADPEIRFIAHYLKRRVRAVNNSHPALTYRELGPILSRYGYALENPKRNRIEVIKLEERSEFFGLFGKKKIIRKHIGTIPYPGPTRQVGQRDLKYLRAMTRLDYKHGIDTTEFLGKADALKSLISSYQEPLKRLADR